MRPVGPFGRCRGPSRRELLGIGAASALGLTLADLLRGNALAAESPADGETRSTSKYFGRAKRLILVFLQGGPSQLDLWDPKENLAERLRSPFKTISTRLPDVQLTELLPKTAKVIDRATLIRSLAYAPEGLFNHTAAMYQSLTGYTADRISPSGQLDPPSPKDFPNLGSAIVKFKPPAVPMLPFVMLPRPLQESNVINKAGTAGFLGKAYDPYPVFPPGEDTDPHKLDRIQLGDLKLRTDVPAGRLQRRAELRAALNRGLPDLEKAIAKLDLDRHYRQALDLILSGTARAALDLSAEPAALRDEYGRHPFGQSCLLARRLIEAGTRVVQVNWPQTANGDGLSLDVHVGLHKRMQDRIGPMLDAGLAALLADLDTRGLLSDTLFVAMGEFGRSPQKGVSTSGNMNSEDGRDHWPYCYTALVAGAGLGRGMIFGRSDATGSAPADSPVHPADLLATIYHLLGIRPDVLLHNHLNQPRELVKGKVIEGLFVG